MQNKKIYLDLAHLDLDESRGRDLFTKAISHAARSKWVIPFLFTIFYFLFTSQAYAATLYISPASGSYSVGSTITLTVRSNTQGVNVNTAEASIAYSTENLELVSVKQGSTFYLASPGSPSKGAGTAYFAGGLPNPGYNGTSGILGTLTFRARAIGTATVSVSYGHVLLNDGNGTDALSGTTAGHYTITPPPIGGPEVISGSHPDQNAWYAKSEVDLSWSRPDKAYGFSFELDQIADTIPDNSLDATNSTIQSYPDLKDGVWYFHIKARAQPNNAAFGGTTHFKIQIDTTAPEVFQIQKSNDVLTFETTDKLSGVDHYDVYADGSLVVAKATSPYTLNNLKAGSHQIEVLAVDKAGNDRKAQLSIMVAAGAGFFQQTITLPIFVLILINLLILILFIIVFWLLTQIRKRIDQKIRNPKKK